MTTAYGAPAAAHAAVMLSSELSALAAALGEGIRLPSLALTAEGSAAGMLR
jgi:hypothetical protein